MLGYPLKIHIRACAFLGLALWLPAFAHAWGLQVVDKSGAAVTDAIVHIDGPHIDTLIPSATTTVATMDQVNREYTPHILPIYQGQHVSFPNSDNVRHHIYSFSKPKSFEIKLYADTLPPPVSFPTPGVVILGCNIHDDMLGYIIVYGSGKFQQTNPKGHVTFTEPIENITSLTIWHPRLKAPTLANVRSQLSASEPNTFAIDITKPPAKAKKSKSGRFYK